VGFEKGETTTWMGLGVILAALNVETEVMVGNVKMVDDSKTFEFRFNSTQAESEIMTNT
jgi:hypothetical protein